MAAWFLAVAPFEINFATRLIWDTSLSALLLAVVFLLTLRMKDAEGALRWSGYGIVWGLVALTNPSLLSFLPIAFFWLWHCSASRRGSRLAIAALTLALTLVPWTLRNHRTLHKFVPLRDNLAMELYLGNHDGAEGFAMTGDHPVWNGREMATYARQGEVTYVAGRMDVFKAFVREHPARFLQLTLRRVLIFWAWGPSMGGGPPVPALRVSVRNSVYLLSSLVTIAGLVLILRRRIRGAFLYAGLMALYPLVYCVTHNNPRYRHPIEPLMALLAAYLLHAVFHRLFRTRRREESPAQVLSVTATSNTETGA
jgi:4-amino-4-deoxy-L-arabinose transferase-like glycosyltransferase